MDVTLTTYNLHGFKQGKVFLPTLYLASDVVLIQEHWLHEDELSLLENVHSDFVCVCTSAMGGTSGTGIRRGRPWGGVGVMLRKNVPSYKTVA